MAAKIRLIEPPKEKFSWVNKFSLIKVGETVRVRKKYTKTIAPIISRDLKGQFPDIDLEIDYKKDDKYLLITRLK